MFYYTTIIYLIVPPGKLVERLDSCDQGATELAVFLFESVPHEKPLLFVDESQETPAHVFVARGSSKSSFQD